MHKLAAVVWALAPVCLHATTLVALWTPEKILIGADSRVVLGTAGAGDACKIAHSGQTWFAVAGLVADPESGFSVGDLLRSSLDTPGPLEGKVDRFILTAQPRLAGALDALRRESEAEFIQFTAGRPVLQAIFAESSGGKPVMATVSFGLDSAGTLQPRASLIDGSDASGPRLIYAGQQTRIREYLRSHRDWISGDQTMLVHNLVQLEVDANTRFVGGPVDVLELGPSGPRWVDAKPACRL